MFFIYSLLYFIVILVLLPFEYVKRPKGFRSRWLRERFGFISFPSVRNNSPLIWVHAVSVGEVISAVPLIRKLKSRHPSLQVILSTVTDTGRRVASEKVSDIADLLYLPFDLVFILEGLFRRIRPDVFVTIETELWPNLFRVLNREGIPILVLNGRLSDDSFNGYRKIRFFIKDVVKYVDLFCMQDNLYKERIKALGADEERIRVIGNFKFDMETPDKIPEWPVLLKGPVILAGSTHEGEEELTASVFERLRNDFPELNMIIAPRHPERFRRVEDLVKAKGLGYVKRSELGIPGAEQKSIEGKIVILDTIGELASAYGIADIAIIGGSFVNHGGHNPLEPAFWGKPVICGPHMENFPFIQDFYREGSAKKTDAEGLYNVLRELIQSPEKRKAMGDKARGSYNEKSGAVNRAVEILERYIEH